MAKATENFVVEIDADSELARVLAEAGRKPVRLVLGDQQYVATRDSFNSVDHSVPEEFEEALRAAAGIMTPEEAERLKRTIYPWRDEEGRRIDPPRLAIENLINDEDLWADYDPEQVRAAVRAAAGSLTEEEGEFLKALIYEGREEGTRRNDRP